MLPSVSPVLEIRRAALALAVTFLAGTAACKGSTDAGPTSTITLISGGNQTVTVVPGGMADLPQPVVVRVETDGVPIPNGDLKVIVSRSVSGPNQQFAFVTGADGMASMQLQVSDVAGPFNIDVTYWICVSGLFFCTATKDMASLTVPGVAVR